jgi:hypothetical protein
MKGIPMKNFRKTVVKAEDLIVDDHIKVAGVLYRITVITKHDRSRTITANNLFRPKIEILLTVDRNTLMNIWNQK